MKVEPYLQIKNAEIGYTEPLLKELSAEILLGRVHLLIGDNGAGKTTLIKTILNQIKPLSGEILLEQKPLARLSAQEVAEKTAIVYAKTHTSHNLTTRDVVALGKYIHYPYYFKLKGEDDLEIQNIINALGLTRYSDIPLTQLSDGNLQKAFIGRAIAQNAPLIILDEPTTHLDEHNKIAILNILRDLATVHNKAILFSSHDWRLARHFADFVWLIKDHKLVTGIAEDVFSDSALLNDPEFTGNKGFVPPAVAAPGFQAKMLLSFLAKQEFGDFSSYKFTFSGGKWHIRRGETIEIAENYQDILNLLGAK